MKRAKKPRPMKYQVNHHMHSGGPKFSSVWEAARYIAHCMSHGEEQSMTIARIKE